MSGTGLSALIYAGAWLGNEFDMEAIACGRGTTSDEDCVLEICGKWFAYHIALRGGEVRLGASLMDDVTPTQTLLRSRDDEGGWDVVRRLVAALERNEIKSLARPIEVGTPPDPDAWLIA